MSGRARRRHPRPELQQLESRRLLASITEFPLPSGSSSAPDGIAAGTNGDLWFTEFNADKIGTIDAASRKITEYPLSTPFAQPFRITRGPDGNFWFTEFNADKIGMIDAKTRKITEFPLATAGAEPYEIAAGPNSTVWFTEWHGNQIGVIDLASAKVTEVAIPTSNSAPQGITLGPDGNIWFTESLGNNIGMINAANHKITEYALPNPGAQPYGITTGPDGNLWFTEYSANKIGVVSKAGVFGPSVTIGAAGSEPSGIAAGPDGNIWFTQSGTNQVAMLNPATRAISESTPPSAFPGPRSITAGPDGRVWFAERNAGNVAVVAPNIRFVVTSGPPAQLESGGGFGLTVTALYDSGAVDTGYSGSVSATVASGPAGGALGGSSIAVAVGGVATFSGLWLTQGGNYMLQISSPDAAAPLSVPINVATAPTTKPPGSTLPSAPVAPTITAERLLFAGQGRQKRLVGFQLVFSSSLDPASAGNPANYTITQNLKNRRVRTAQALRLRVSYDGSARTVNLLILGKPRFQSGGQLLVNASAPSGIMGTSGVYLDGQVNGQPGDDGVFVILPGGRGLVR
jgi:virginiamycin B lyase